MEHISQHTSRAISKFLWKVEALDGVRVIVKDFEMGWCQVGVIKESLQKNLLM